MQYEEIVSRLFQITDNPSEVIYSITMQQVLTAIAYRMGDKACPWGTPPGRATAPETNSVCA